MNVRPEITDGIPNRRHFVKGINPKKWTDRLIAYQTVDSQKRGKYLKSRHTKKEEIPKSKQRRKAQEAKSGHLDVPKPKGI